MTPMQRQVERARFHVIALFRWQRVLGLSITAVVLYFLVFVVFGRTDVSWALPKAMATHFGWPNLPHFLTWKEQAPDGREETVYTVPSRQLTPQELSELTATNAPPPAPSAR